MLSSMHRFAPTLARASTRVNSINKRTMLALSDQMKSREKVEEDRYMRAQTEAWKEKLRQLKEAEASELEEQYFKDVIEPVMDDIEKMLAETGDKVSKEGLEALAKFKVDL